MIYYTTGVKERMKFTELDLHEKLMQGITDAGFTDCMPVQEETLVHTLKSKDVEVQSQTGTGFLSPYFSTSWTKTAR
jgi:ATP-dependent RNA helicase RhlB